jgi:hypothetical protein
MEPMIRSVAALLVAVLLPLQGYAAACAQICAASGNAHGAVADEVGGEADGHCHESPATAHHDEGGAPETGVAKCCQAHVFAIDRAVATAGPGLSHPIQASFVARWSSFIADEPSPPPIPALTHA